MYLNGYGVDADVDKAEMLFKFAMEKGEPDAENAMELLAQKRLQLEGSLDSSVSGAEGSEVGRAAGGGGSAHRAAAAVCSRVSSAMSMAWTRTDLGQNAAAAPRK